MLQTKISNEIDLSISNEPPVKILIDRVRNSFGDNLKKIILYGSRARGDHHEYSDYDILVLVKEFLPDWKNKVADIGGDLLFEYSLLFPMLVLSEPKFDADNYEPLYRNIRKEGKLLWTKTNWRL